LSNFDISHRPIIEPIAALNSSTPMEKVSELIFESPSHGGSWIFGIAMSFVLSVIFTVTFFSKEEDVAGWIFVLLSLLSGFGLANILLSIWFPQKIVVSDGSLKVFRMHRYLPWQDGRWDLRKVVRFSDCKEIQHVVIETENSTGEHISVVLRDRKERYIVIVTRTDIEVASEWESELLSKALLIPLVKIGKWR
jgi:hypothetical protein